MTFELIRQLDLSPSLTLFHANAVRGSGQRGATRFPATAVLGLILLEF